MEVIAVDQVDFAEQAEDVCPPVQHHLELATAGVAAVFSDSVSASLEVSLSPTPPHQEQQSYSD